MIVQVLVKADGSFTVQRVIKSTNPGDEAAALEIAKSSTFKPAIHLGKPQTAFKDFTLNFNGSGASVGGGSAEVENMNALLSAGKYADAKSASTAYLGSHPKDQQAGAVLGAADAFLNDPAGAAAAFDKVDPVPPKYVNLAAQAYEKNAANLSAAKDYDGSIASAKRSIALAPSISAYNTLGLAETGKGDPTSAIRDLEHAGRFAQADPKLTPVAHGIILGNLASAYAAAGEMDKAKSAVEQARKIDPKTSAGDGVASVLAQRAQQESAAKNFAAAGANYSLAAEFSPANASALYTNASYQYSASSLSRTATRRGSSPIRPSSPTRTTRQRSTRWASAMPTTRCGTTPRRRSTKRWSRLRRPTSRGWSTKFKRRSSK